MRSVRHADDAVIVEFDLLGAHLGPLRGLPPTGKSFRCPMVAIFFEGEFVTCERVDFDSAAILQQLGVLPTLPREGLAAKALRQRRVGRGHRCR